VGELRGLGALSRVLARLARRGWGWCGPRPRAGAKGGPAAHLAAPGSASEGPLAPPLTVTPLPLQFIPFILLMLVPCPSQAPPLPSLPAPASAPPWEAPAAAPGVPLLYSPLDLNSLWVGQEPVSANRPEPRLRLADPLPEGSQGPFRTAHPGLPFHSAVLEPVAVTLGEAHQRGCGVGVAGGVAAVTHHVGV